MRRLAGRGGREPGVAPLAREERREPVDGGVGEVERELGRAERGGREAGEDRGGLVELGEDRRVLGRVRVGRARARQVGARVGRVEREEVALEEPLGA